MRSDFVARGAEREKECFPASCIPLLRPMNQGESRE